jgi:hypothetical protein
MSKKIDGKLALAMMIGGIGSKIPKCNKGFNGNNNLSRGEMDIDDLEKSAREILGYPEKEE